MKFRYDAEDDALMIDLNKGKIDYAEQADNLIVHFTKDSKPVLLEILEARDFLLKGFQTAIKPQRRLQASVK